MSLVGKSEREEGEAMADPEPQPENDLYDKRHKLQAELEKLHGPARRVKETEIQDVDAAIAKLKKKPKNDVLY
jgi:hypothetical protein